MAQFSRTILHVDMDAFFASVEQRDNPELEGKCVVVGGRSKRSVVAAASYEARKYGVHSAMPIFMATQKCPELVVVPVRKSRYQEISRAIMSILNNYSPLVEPVSIDEAYLDITGCERLFGKQQNLALKIKKQIKGQHNLTCSVGIGPNKFLAKIASDMNKPDGLTIIAPADAIHFIDSLPIHKVPGVGKIAFSQLDAIGIKTLGQIKRCSKKILIDKFGKFGRRLFELSCCIDNSPVVPHVQPKSVSSEETLPQDTDDKNRLMQYLLQHSDDIGSQLRKMNVYSKTITLKIKYLDFKLVTKSITLKRPTRSSEIIYQEAKKLLTDFSMINKVRLIGLGASGLISVGTPVQISLFNESNKKSDNWQKVDEAVDSITEKFGKKIIKKASLHNH